MIFQNRREKNQDTICDNVPVLSSFSVLLHVKDPCFKQQLWVKPWIQLGLSWGIARASYLLKVCSCLLSCTVLRLCPCPCLFTRSLNIYLILRIITMFYNNKIRFTNITSNLPHFLYYVYASGDGILMKRSNRMTNSIQTYMMVT